MVACVLCCVCSRVYALEGEKIVSGPLDLAAGSRTWVVCESGRSSCLLSNAPAHVHFFSLLRQDDVTHEKGGIGYCGCTRAHRDKLWTVDRFKSQSVKFSPTLKHSFIDRLFEGLVGDVFRRLTWFEEL